MRQQLHLLVGGGGLPQRALYCRGGGCSWHLGLSQSREALAAVEFALLLPVLITMLFGMGELSLAVFCRTDISQIAITVADLVAQERRQHTDLSNVYNAANTILYPYYPNLSTSKPTIRITSVIFDTSANSTTVGKVAWTCSQSGNGTLSPASRA